MDTALTYLARCKREMQELVGLVQGGKLPEAVERYRDVEVLLAEQQPSLQGTEVYVDLQVCVQPTFALVSFDRLSSVGSAP